MGRNCPCSPCVLALLFGWSLTYHMLHVYSNGHVCCHCCWFTTVHSPVISFWYICALIFKLGNEWLPMLDVEHCGRTLWLYGACWHPARFALPLSSSRWMPDLTICRRKNGMPCPSSCLHASTSSTTTTCSFTMIYLASMLGSGLDRGGRNPCAWRIWALHGNWSIWWRGVG